VTVVAQIREVKPLSTKVNIKLDDGTGMIELMKWVDIDKMEEESSKYEVDQFVRVFGRLKTSGRRHINSQVIRPVTDYNEVNYHMLEATYVHLMNAKGASGGQGGANGANGGEDSMFVDGGGGGNAGGMSRVAGCSGPAQKVYGFLMNAPGGNEGVHSNVIARSTGMSVRDVQAAADELTSQGIVYNLIDDDTWAILEY
jgi:replication factor A2